jgi:hypothetical protein
MITYINLIKMNKKQKIKRIEELLMGYHIDSGLNPSKKAAKINKDYFLAEVARVVTKKSKVTTPKTPNEDKPFGSWYVWNDYPKFLIFEGVKARCGSNVRGVWFKDAKPDYPRPINPDLRLATEQEIVEKLSAYANSIGIKHNRFVTLLTGCKVKLYNTGDCIVKESNSFIFGNQVVMQGGVWATAAKQADTPTTYIKHNKI